MQELLTLYKKYCRYDIIDNVQELDFTFDVDRLRKELFKFIIDNNFGFSAVSLRLPKDRIDYVSSSEKLEAGAIDPSNYRDIENIPENTIHNKEYLYWHPDLENSYISSLVSGLEKTTGFHIGRIRLGWLQPGSGYPMHYDLEPMRLHIPLLTNRLSYFIHENNLYNMKYGKLYHLITTGAHTAWNFGKIPRLHLIFSTYADETIDSEITKLSQLELTSKNFIDLVKNQGIDHYSLTELFRISESIEKFDAKTRLDMLREIKKISDLLS